MKKLLAMVLALVMTLSLAVSVNAFKDDTSLSDDYAEAVAVLNCDATNVNSHNTGAVTITKGKTATIAGFTNTVVANTDTMLLVMDKDSNGNYTYYKNCCCKLTIRLYR